MSSSGRVREAAGKSDDTHCSKTTLLTCSTGPKSILLGMLEPGSINCGRSARASRPAYRDSTLLRPKTPKRTSA